MTGTLIVNNLAGLMMFTSLLVTCARRYTVSCWLYALQSLVLVSILLARRPRSSCCQVRSLWRSWKSRCRPKLTVIRASTRVAVRPTSGIVGVMLLLPLATIGRARALPSQAMLSTSMLLKAARRRRLLLSPLVRSPRLRVPGNVSSRLLCHWAFCRFSTPKRQYGTPAQREHLRNAGRG